MINASSTDTQNLVDPSTVVAPTASISAASLDSTRSHTFKTPARLSKLPKKYFLGLLVVVLMVVGVAIAGVLTQVNQDIRNQAAGAAGYLNQSCVIKYGNLTAMKNAMATCTTDKPWNNTTCTCLPRVTTPTTPQQPAQVCGNQSCESTETISNCPQDCEPQPYANSGETCVTTADCLSNRVCTAIAPDLSPICMNYFSDTSSNCGNDTCDAPAESITNCPSDCLSTEPQIPPTDESTRRLVGTTCYFAAANNTRECGGDGITVCDMNQDGTGVCKLAQPQNCDPNNNQCASNLICGLSSTGDQYICKYPEPTNVPSTTPPSANVIIRRGR